MKHDFAQSFTDFELCSEVAYKRTYKKAQQLQVMTLTTKQTLIDRSVHPHFCKLWKGI